MYQADPAGLLLRVESDVASGRRLRCSWSLARRQADFLESHQAIGSRIKNELISTEGEEERKNAPYEKPAYGPHNRRSKVTEGEHVQE